MDERQIKYGVIDDGTGSLAEMDVMPRAPYNNGNKRKVYLQVIFLKLGEIDTVKECFTADVCVKSRWREPSLDGKTHLKKSKNIVWDDYWQPKLYTDNAVGEPKEVISKTFYFDDDKKAYICEQRRIRGTFLENLELYEFPFDTQDISLTLISELPEEEVDLEVDPFEASTINKQSFVDEQEWNLYGFVETNKDVCTILNMGSSRERHSRISFTCRAARRFGFYLWNICFVMFFICSMTFTTFAVDYTLPQNRLQLTFILLLTTITFKFAVNSSLPRISYLTYMDKYILLSMTILVAVCCWHAIIYAAIFKSDVSGIVTFWIDKGVLVFTGLAYCTAHIAFFLFIYFGVLKKRRENETLDQQHVIRTKTRQVRV